jgi:A/G-specific adenine glycosylase
MLQQTQVATALPYFDRWMRRFPDVSTLAQADLEEVLKLWEGLGYYRRARDLHRASKIINDRKMGGFPQTVKEWMALPGIGRYTAGAIVSIATNQPAPVLDGNVIRVLARAFRIRGDVTTGAVKKRLWTLAESLLPEEDARNFNQGLMELGATVCTPAAPRCELCPVCSHCKAYARNEHGLLPHRRPRKKTVKLEGIVGIVVRRGKVLVRRRPAEGRMGALWEFPQLWGESSDPTKALQRELHSKHGLHVQDARVLKRVKHSFTHHRIDLLVLAFEHVKGRMCRGQWADVSDLETLPFPAPHRKIADTLKHLTGSAPRAT